MSLNKKLCLRSDSQNSDSFSDCLVNKFESKEDNYRRDSFCDRFCDDLCPEILQYLSLKDKLRMQCVSKQFQRTVFQRHYELYINTSKIDHKSYLKYKRLYFIRRENKYYYIEDKSSDSFKALLKKCPNITSIELDGPHWTDSSSGYNSDKISEVFRLIVENCNNLREITVFNDLSDSNFEEFHQKFGPKIKNLRFFDDLIEKFESIPKH